MSSSSDSDSSEDDIQDQSRYWPAPTESKLELAGSYSNKPVLALAINKSGTRFAAGGQDNTLRVWDFSALDIKRPWSIGSSEPCGQTIIRSLDFSSNDELILVISESCQASITTKDGSICKEYHCPKGDQYLTDMANTKGHVQFINDGQWNPREKQVFITCSNDGTIRIWDINDLKSQTTVIKSRSPVSGLRAKPTVCRYSNDALTIASGCNDGTILMWDTRRKFLTTTSSIKTAHRKECEITGIDFSYHLNRLCSRADDETCKVWDLRQLKSPLSTRQGLRTLYSTTDCSFSPDDKFVITGASNSSQEPGQLLFLDADDLTEKYSIDTEGTSVIRSRWHPKINHIAYTCSDGSMFMCYDKKRSLGGLLVEPKSNRLKRPLSDGYDLSTVCIKKIITPHALPLFRDEPTKGSYAKIRQDPKLSYKPEVPVAGSSQTVSVRPAGSTLSSFIARNIAKPTDDDDLNIRDRILRHAEAAANDPRWVKPTPESDK